MSTIGPLTISISDLDTFKALVTAHALLCARVEALYFAAHWTPDRQCDAAKLWEAVRNAAGIAPGQTAERLGPRK